MKHGNERLEDKKILNEIILIGFFLKAEEDFPFLDRQKGLCLHLTITHPVTPSSPLYKTVHSVPKLNLQSDFVDRWF